MRNKKNHGTFILVLYIFIFKPITYLITYITRFYPLNLLFTDRLIHAKWVGAYRIINSVEFTSGIYKNKFIDVEYDKDEDNYFVFGKFKNKPNAKLLASIQKFIGNDGLEIRYCGEFENGKHKFMAPVNQNWMKWTWFF